MEGVFIRHRNSLTKLFLIPLRLRRILNEKNDNTGVRIFFSIF